MTTLNTATRRFWDQEPEPVRAILDLAYARDDLTPEVHDRILSTITPQHADTIARIAEDLYLAERLRSDYPTQVLSDYYDAPVHALFADREADRLAEEREHDAVRAAQLVASLLTTPVRKLVAQ